jgi:CrcB protein
MQAYLIVFFGAGIGGALRHAVNVWSAQQFAAPFPVGTFIINTVGSLVMGLFAGYFLIQGVSSQHWRLFLTTGIIGGFTTFSAFSLEAALLYERGELAIMTLYVVSSVLVSVVALFAGSWAVRSFLP